MPFNCVALGLEDEGTLAMERMHPLVPLAKLCDLDKTPEGFIVSDSLALVGIRPQRAAVSPSNEEREADILAAQEYRRTQGSSYNEQPWF